jgi:hypothetical protein
MFLLWMIDALQKQTVLVGHHSAFSFCVDTTRFDVVGYAVLSCWSISTRDTSLPNTPTYIQHTEFSFLYWNRDFSFLYMYQHLQPIQRITIPISTLCNELGPFMGSAKGQSIKHQMCLLHPTSHADSVVELLSHDQEVMSSSPTNNTNQI